MKHSNNKKNRVKIDHGVKIERSFPRKISFMTNDVCPHHPP